MNWNVTMAYTAILFLMVFGVLCWAATYPPLLVPAAGAGFILIVGQFLITHYQTVYRDQARVLFRIYVFPVAALGVLGSWLISVARHHQLLARWPY